MDIHQLSFGKIILLEDNLAEVIVDEGVEMDIAMIEEYHTFLLENLVAPFSLLINKRHHYSYTFEAQKNIATLDEIKAIAVIAYNQRSEVAQQALNEVPRKIAWNLETFSNREMALDWLHKEAY